MQLRQSGIIHQSLKPISRVADVAERLGLSGVANLATISAVRVYQKHLSPRKGFACAHRRLYGQESCSQYFRKTVATHGLVKAIPLFQERLQECHQANLTLQRQYLAVTTGDDDPINDDQTNEDQGKNKPGRKSKNDACRDSGWWDSCSYGDCSGCEGVDFNLFDRNRDGNCDVAACSTPDCGAPDCGNCGDCNGCDSGGCDAGGCGGN